MRWNVGAGEFVFELASPAGQLRGVGSYHVSTLYIHRGFVAVRLLPGKMLLSRTKNLLHEPSDPEDKWSCKEFLTTFKGAVRKIFRGARFCKR